MLVGNAIISHRKKSWAIVSLRLIIFPDFQHPPTSYCQLKEIKIYEFGISSNVITSIPNFMNIRQAIVELLYAYGRWWYHGRWRYQWSQRIMVMQPLRRIILLPHDFQHPSPWDYQLYQTRKYDFGVAPNGITSMPNFMRIHPAILELLYALQAMTPSRAMTSSVVTQDHGKWRHCGGLSLHLTNLGIIHIGITHCKKLKGTRFDYPKAANFHTKFHENTFSGSRVSICVRTDERTEQTY
jgi:hypothetical protein